LESGGRHDDVAAALVFPEPQDVAGEESHVGCRFPSFTETDIPMGGRGEVVGRMHYLTLAYAYSVRDDNRAAGAVDDLLVSAA
jgi:hypothetical protein